MTDLHQLTDEQIRIAVAERCGWTRRDNRHLHGSMEQMKWYWLSPQGLSEYVPDYPNDLNRMAEARERLTKFQQGVFAESLHESMNCCAIGYVPHDREFNELFRVLDATARQHALAFLACFPETQGGDK